MKEPQIVSRSELNSRTRLVSSVVASVIISCSSNSNTRKNDGEIEENAMIRDAERYLSKGRPENAVELLSKKISSRYSPKIMSKLNALIGKWSEGLERQGNYYKALHLLETLARAIDPEKYPDVFRRIAVLKKKTDQRPPCIYDEYLSKRFMNALDNLERGKVDEAIRLFEKNIQKRLCTNEALLLANVLENNGRGRDANIIRSMAMRSFQNSSRATPQTHFRNGRMVQYWKGKPSPLGVYLQKDGEIRIQLKSTGRLLGSYGHISIPMHQYHVYPYHHQESTTVRLIAPNDEEELQRYVEFDVVTGDIESTSLNDINVLKTATYLGRRVVSPPARYVITREKNDGPFPDEHGQLYCGKLSVTMWDTDKKQKRFGVNRDDACLKYRISPDYSQVALGLFPMNSEPKHPEIIIFALPSGKVVSKIDTRKFVSKNTYSKICERTSSVGSVGIVDILPSKSLIAVTITNSLEIWDYNNGISVYHNQGPFWHAEDGRFDSSGNNFIVYKDHPIVIDLNKKKAVRHKRDHRHQRYIHFLYVDPENGHLIIDSDDAYDVLDLRNGVLKRASISGISREEFSKKGYDDDSQYRYDNEIGKSKYAFIGRREFLTKMAISDTYFAVSTLKGLEIWDNVKKEKMITYVPIDKKDWVAYTPDGYVDATDNVRHVLGWRIEGRLYPYDLGWLRYHIPDLMGKVLRGDTAFRLNNLHNLTHKK